MTCATGLCGVGHERAAGATELMVEHHGSGERGEPGAQADTEVGEGACTVAFEGEDVLRGPEDRFDSLADWGEMRAAAGFVLASGSHDCRVQVGELGLEVLAAEVLVADQ